eukprot:scaffold132950_cov23-Tisochrysis_lutea.AAC.1
MSCPTAVHLQRKLFLACNARSSIPACQLMRLMSLCIEFLANRVFFPATEAHPNFQLVLAAVKVSAGKETAGQKRVLSLRNHGLHPAGMNSSFESKHHCCASFSPHLCAHA